MIYVQMALGVIFFVLLTIIAVTGLIVLRELKTQKRLSPQDSSIDKNISAIVNILKEEKDAAESEARDKELIRLAKEHNKQASPIVSSAPHGEDYVKTDGDLVPFGLGEVERTILRDFYK